MDDDSPRSTPLAVDEILEFWGKGYLTPGRVLSLEQVESLRDIADRIRQGQRTTEAGGDLFNPGGDLGTDAHAAAPGEGNDEDARDEVEYYFGLWTRNAEFRALSFNPVLATWAAQLIGARQVRLL